MKSLHWESLEDSNIGDDTNKELSILRKNIQKINETNLRVPKDTLQDIKKFNEEQVRKKELKIKELQKEWENFYVWLKWAEKPDKDAFSYAYVWYKSLNPKNKRYLTVIDFHPKNKNGRLYIINMDTKTVEYSNQVAHWSGSRPKNWNPEWFPDSYSNEPGSNQTSLWFFETADVIKPWVKHIREWLSLKWKEQWINDNASSRWIYIHPAWMEQSEWCFILPYNKAEWQEWEDKILNQIAKIQWWSTVFAYDNRVFEQYKKESPIFWINSEASGKFLVNWTSKEAINERIKKQQNHGSDSLREKTQNTLIKRLSPERERKCRRIKKELEKLKERFKNYIDREIKNDDLEKKLKKSIDTQWRSFTHRFYSNAENPLKLVKDLESNVNNLIANIIQSIPINMYTANIHLEFTKLVNEYKQREKKSEENHRKIPEDERFNERNKHKKTS